MADFKVIETQEQLDALISDRIGRAKDSVRKEYEGFISPSDYATKTEELQRCITEKEEALKDATEKLAVHEAAIAERDSKIKGYELTAVKTSIAHEMGLTFDAIDFLHGADEVEIRKSAESLKTLVGTSRTAPLSSIGADSISNSKEAALKEMLQSINSK